MPKNIPDTLWLKSKRDNRQMPHFKPLITGPCSHTQNRNIHTENRIFAVPTEHKTNKFCI
jgi:hypothetical protein